ncbi:putative UBX domain-containing protein 2/7 [Rosa chinensis]|uniref:UBX domain-containing protein n=1 Tax=Rosa chinensis TaxID=74649 RepID=A0A2P6R4P0_ROSCH|nr:plant UBX domain-containing protein 7 [Rosa chinensis]PRQ41329.1 putative UBX domain-containing protein 2/7 [Rosa chinensis]
MKNNKRKKSKISDGGAEEAKPVAKVPKTSKPEMEAGSAEEQQSMVALFMEIAAGQTDETARRFLQATGWNLEEALQLFYVGNEAGAMAPPQPPAENASNLAEQSSGVDENVAQYGEDEVRAPMPVIRDVLYDDVALYGAGLLSSTSPMTRLPVNESGVIAFRNFNEELKHPGVWESNEGATSATDSSRDNLASLYRPPFQLLFQGSFEKAKSAASVQDKWLMVNLQSNSEFSSHMLNRDTWANEAVSQTIITNFIFWQTYDDTTEGRKVCTYYKLESMPVVLIIDPITGQKMRSWNGMVQPERLLEDLLPFMDSGPRDHHLALSNKRPRESSLPQPQNTNEQASEEDEEVQRALAASMGSMKGTSGTISKDEEEIITDKEEETSLPKVPTYPPLPEEPKGDKSLICRVGVRLPDGRRAQRNFLRIDPIQLLWSFCHSQLKEERPIRLTHAVPGATKCLDYDCESTFEESGLPNTMVSVTWE